MNLVIDEGRTFGDRLRFWRGMRGVLGGILLATRDPNSMNETYCYSGASKVDRGNVPFVELVP